MMNSPARPVDWLIFLAVPVFFSSNIIFGRGIIGDVAPFTTAFIRWSGATLVMLPFLYRQRQECVVFVRNHTLLWLTLGFLGMGICGGVVYWGLTMTSAANATLIYTTSSVFIILFQWLFLGRRIGWPEMAGMAISFAGVATIVLKGDLPALLHLDFNAGDLAILAAAISFAVYSLLLRNPATGGVSPPCLFGLFALSGAILLFPVAAWETISGAALPDSLSDWLKIAGIIVFASLAAFYCFLHTVNVFGPATAGITLYMMPPLSILMAWMFLGERFELYHAIGIVFVTCGVALATRPVRADVRD